MSVNNYLSRIQESINELEIKDLDNKLDYKLENNNQEIQKIKIIDIRESEELSNGSIIDSIHIPRGFLESRIENYINKDDEIILYCASGIRSTYGANTLKELGYEYVYSLKGGFNQYLKEGNYIKEPINLSNNDFKRYARHFSLPEVGINGQEKLLNSKVLIVGAGGLGAPIALYLAASGIGTIGIVDDDKVDISNLQRQVIHNQSTVGLPKVLSAYQTMKALNSDINIETYQTRINKENVREILSKYDIIVDAVDNLATRYLLNEITVRLNIPLVSASVIGFEGQVSVFNIDNACYRCIYPEPPPSEMVPNCAIAGVLGVVPGIIGLTQANEVLKLILDIGKPLSNNIQLYDALDSKWMNLKVTKNPNCLTCSNIKEINEEIEDFEDLCSGI